MAHASGWGNRVGAYAGGDTMTSEGTGVDSVGHSRDENEFGTLESLGIPESWSTSSATAGAHQAESALGGTAVQEYPVAEPVVAQSRRAQPARRRLNPKAAIPYLIGLAIFVLEGFLIV